MGQIFPADLHRKVCSSIWWIKSCMSVSDGFRVNLRHFPKEPSRAAMTEGLGASASPAAPRQSLGQPGSERGPRSGSPAQGQRRALS